MKRNWQYLALVGALAVPAGASAQQFNSGIPFGWTCIGTCGTLGANGNIAASPTGFNYGYVTTDGGVAGQNLPGVGGSGTATNGTTLRSVLFTANANAELDFYFNYITSDGAGFADYAWARLLNADLTEAALLFTARTTPDGSNIVPGLSMPAPAATLTPLTVLTQAGTTWSPLGGSSGSCYSTGCGHSGWVFSEFVIASAGNYILEFGVTNWNDEIYDSGMAFDGFTVDGEVIGGVPEPISMILMGTGLVGIGVARRRRKNGNVTDA